MTYKKTPENDFARSSPAPSLCPATQHPKPKTASFRGFFRLVSALFLLRNLAKKFQFQKHLDFWFQTILKHAYGCCFRKILQLEMVVKDPTFQVFPMSWLLACGHSPLPVIQRGIDFSFFQQPFFKYPSPRKTLQKRPPTFFNPTSKTTQEELTAGT